MPPREFPMPFSQVIIDVVIPATFVGPKATFTGVEDPEAHFTAFHTQIMFVGASDAVRCKLFMSTLVGTMMDWFISLPDGHITSFAQLSKLFREQYIANRAPQPISYDLFNVRQYQEESLKEFLYRFGAQVVRLNIKDETMMVHAFRKGIVPGLFSESLIRNCPKTFDEIRRGGSHRYRGRSQREVYVCCSHTPMSTRLTSTLEGTRGNDREEDSGEAATLPTQEAPNQRACKGKYTTKA